MASLIIYGSLMAKDELQSLGIKLSLASPIIVQGFQRIFAQEPSWRPGTGRNRAVLTVVRSPLDSFNGILIREVTQNIFAHLDIRERGYERHQISTQAMKPFEGSRALTDDVPYLYVGKPEKFNSSLLPNLNYRAKCIHAAREWGNRFYQEFCLSTGGL